MSCPESNSDLGVEDCFFCPDGIHWTSHVIGWTVAGGCAAVTTLVTLFTLTMHARNYQQPAAQRQVMRVLLMPPVYAIVSWFSYRYYQSYEYYVLAETAYEAVTLSAFLMLLMELVALGTADKDVKSRLAEKDKRKLPFPFNCLRFRASKPYFMHALSFSVMQYVIIRPLISIAGIICEYYGVLCVQQYSVHFAEVYLEAVDFVSISIALYGLIVFYVLCKDELKGRRPLNKFLAIKLIVFFTFYQSFMFSILQSYGVIKGSDLWTADNVKNGLSALCTCIEMVFFSIYMGWAYSWKDYTDPKMNPAQRPTGWGTYFQAIWDTVNLSDFGIEIWLAIKFFFNFLRGVEGTRSQPTKMQQTFMPDTIAPQEKIAMTSLGSPSHRPFSAGSKRSPSSGLFSPSSDSYRRIEEGHQTEPEAFPEARPTGLAPASAGTDVASPTSYNDDSVYATPPQSSSNRAEWPELHPAMPGSGGQGWSELHQANTSPRPHGGGAGIEGNPRLY